MQKMIADGAIRAAFEAKKKDLLASIAAGGVDVGLDPSVQGKESGKVEDQPPVGDTLSKVTATQDKALIDRAASEEGSRKSLPKTPLANDPTSILKTVEVQDSAIGIPAKPKDSPLTGSLSTTVTASVPESDTAPPVEAKDPLEIDSQSTSGAIDASKPMTTLPPESQHRRAKLDVSSAKRMLFGSLGLRTPKTKDDEVRMREKLMKDVRPPREPHVAEKLETAENITAPAEDEGWKDKIDLRAVECCYEGIELSTPPFPFVQRWDPQQQRGYSMGSAKKRKGKKRKRNNTDYYEDNSTSLKSKVVRLDKDDWQRQEAESEPVGEEANAKSNNHDYSHDERVEDSIRANQQLLHETEDASADTLVEVEEPHDLTEDLPTLPEDISICSSLNLQKATEGSIVAFKQLEMSAETNWQPKISKYRTAIVNEVLDNGMLSMTLAKRDQPSKNLLYDEQTGERLYSKFEMPGYHDENGGDESGKLEISFDELINPVLVEAASRKGAQDVVLQGEDNTVAHIDTNDKAVIEHAHGRDAGPEGVNRDCRIHEASNNAAAQSSEEARQEISELIRDAGWRSSINHALTDPQDEDAPGQSQNLIEPALIRPKSPRFQGFNSSPVTNDLQVASSPPAAAFQTSRHVYFSGSEIAESVSPQRRDVSPAASDIPNRRSPIDYPDLPQMNEDSEVLQQEAQNRSALVEVDHQIVSQDLTLSGSIRRSSSPINGSVVLESHEQSSQKHAIDGADSDESLPELFSQAFEKCLSQSRDIKSEPSEGDSISPPGRRKSKRNSRIDLSQRESDRDWEPDASESEPADEGGSTPRQSQTGFSSQIVDLTISSDTVDPPDDSYADDDSYVLPRGPGWVQKSRMRERQIGPIKKTTRASMRRS